LQQTKKKRRRRKITQQNKLLQQYKNIPTCEEGIEYTKKPVPALLAHDFKII